VKTALVTRISGQDSAYLAQPLLGKGYRVFGTLCDALSFEQPIETQDSIYLGTLNLPEAVARLMVQAEVSQGL
jgi:GDP-D-mannose dehydratase